LVRQVRSVGSGITCSDCCDIWWARPRAFGGHFWAQTLAGVAVVVAFAGLGPWLRFPVFSVVKYLNHSTLFVSPSLTLSISSLIPNFRHASGFCLHGSHYVSLGSLLQSAASVGRRAARVSVPRWRQLQSIPDHEAAGPALLFLPSGPQIFILRATSPAERRL